MTTQRTASRKAFGLKRKRTVLVPRPRRVREGRYSNVATRYNRRQLERVQAFSPTSTGRHHPHRALKRVFRARLRHDLDNNDGITVRIGLSRAALRVLRALHGLDAQRE